jgi:hypothetical protein
LKLVGDAVVELLAEQLEIAEKGASAEGEALHEFLRALPQAVAGGDEVFLWRRQFLQAGI